MRIGILGSSFDPPHKEHIAIGEHARRALKLERIVFVPLGKVPYKKESGVPPHLRYEMAKLAIGGRSGWKLSGVGIFSKKPLATKDILAALQTQNPRAKLFWIMGSDALLAMPWKFGWDEKLLDTYSFVVIPRKGFPVARAKPEIRRRAIVLPYRGRKISSGIVREELRAGKSVRGVLEPAVLKFIQKHGLYR